MVSEFVVVWVELNWLRDVAGSAFFCEKGRPPGVCCLSPGLRRGQPRISSPPAESGDRQHTPHGLVFQGGRGGWLLGSLGVNVGLSGLPGMR